MTRDTEQEVKPCKFVGGACVNCDATERGDCQGFVYNPTPPQRQWVGLTDEDCKRMHAGDKLVAMWAEAKLKERNT